MNTQLENTTFPRHAVSLAFGGLLLSAVDTVFALASGWLHPPGYFLLCAALAIVASGALGALADLWSGLRRWVVPIWVGATALALDDGDMLNLAEVWGVGIPLTPVLAAAGFLAIRWLVGLRRCGVGSEVIVGAGALTAGFLLLSRVMIWIQPKVMRAPSGAEESAQVTLALLGTVLVLAAVARLLARRPAGQHRALLCALILLPCMGPLLTRGAHEQEISQPAGARTATSPSIVVLVLDTVGANRLSLYGAERDTTAGLDAFLSRRDNAALFPQAYANSSWTGPSHASLITGLIPSEHGGHRRKGNTNIRQVMALHADRTLPEALRAAGYSTVGVFSNWLAVMRGFERGFDRIYRPLFPRQLSLLGEQLHVYLMPGVYAQSLKPYPDAATISRHVLAELEPCAPGGCFLLVNYLDAHEPYIPGPECAGRFGPPWGLRERTAVDGNNIRPWDPPERIEHLAARHDEELCQLDRSLASLLESLEQTGFMERSWVFIVGDHGEAFAEHGSVGHATSVYNEQVRVPLIVLPPPGISVEVTRAPVSLIDLTATIAEIAGVAPVGAGRSLLSNVADREVKIETYAIARDLLEQGGEGSFEAAAIVTQGHKLMLTDGELSLFDLTFDPDETVNVLEKSRGVARDLSSRLPSLRVAPGPTESLSREEYEMLRELGYVK